MPKTIVGEGKKSMQFMAEVKEILIVYDGNKIHDGIKNKRSKNDIEVKKKPMNIIMEGKESLKNILR